ncbi:Beta-lactamase/transpeptidase-like protein [Metarhizium guizhouense ARSEF 977]|uniref:Beta-lactamase/transpeptidase-like protein n=1 Tax=Metarhizium guizhouense (strain ARSEF 977) TaxID=1276136 RepID=A0A0B4GY23_METGA|nr:Beta-lactamase/transpeptidase-like protein [Metarhizium guizhouense ARSEF 977]
MLLYLCFFSLSCLTSATADFDQKVLGQTYPFPENLGSAHAVRTASSYISHELQNALNTGLSKFGNMTGKTNSLSATMLSAQDSQPFLDFHYSAANLNVSGGSTKRVTGNSVYRIGSISKLFTVYSLLLNGGEKIWDMPVTNYLPELRKAVSQMGANSAIDHVQWDKVTVGALASQLAGIGRDEFFDVLLKRRPVSLPFNTPTYSNAAYRLLGYVVEAVTGTSYTEAVAKSVFQPLGLQNTSTSSPGGTGVGVIPPGNSGWGRPLGDEVSTGGLYSTSRDLAHFGCALLNHRQLSPLQTRRWMKPHAHTASPFFSVGAPWEIWRTRSRISSGYTIDLYTKSGSDDQYQALLILVPEYNIVASFLCAGPNAGPAINMAAEVALQSILPVLDRVSQSQAFHRFGGRYVSSDAKNSSLLLTTDDQGPGLLVKEWLSNGVNVQEAAQAYSDGTGGGTIKSIRLYPFITNTKDASSTGSSGSQASFRAILETEPVNYGPRVLRILNADAGQWGRIDQLMYGEIAVDDFTFQMDGHGIATAVQPRVMRDTLKRV